MSKGPRISAAERRLWLERWEKGESIEKLARESRRTERTVKDGIKRAQQEKEHWHVRLGLLKEAYDRHYRDLLAVAEKLRERATRENASGLWPDPDAREGMLLEALRSHTARWDMWKAWKEWEEQARRAEGIKKRLRRQAGQDVQKVVGRYRGVHAAEWVESAVSALDMLATGRDLGELPYRIQDADGKRRIWCGRHLLADNLDSEEKASDILSEHVRWLERWARSLREFASRLKEANEAWDYARERIRGDVDILALRRLLPGECELCPGIDRRPRRSRRARRRER